MLSYKEIPAFLKRELENRIKKNPNYSLRSFARALGVHPSQLSLTMNGKREPSKTLIKKAASLVVDHPVDVNQLILEKKLGESLPKQTTLTRDLSLDQFELVADWVHYAVLGLAQLKNNKWESHWISQKLGISELQAKMVMERLLRLEVIKVKKSGNFCRVVEPLRVNNTTSSGAAKRFNHQIIDLAKEAMDNLHFEERHISSMCIAMDPATYNWAVQECLSFRRELASKLSSAKNKSEVYFFNIQWVPVTKKRSKL